MAFEPTDLREVLRHERALRRLATALCRSPADADDAVQHALTQAALGRRPRGAPMVAFLRTTLRNHLANLRKLAQRRRRHEGERAATAPQHAMPVDELVARDQLRRQVASAVLALDEPYRTTVWLRWFEDLATADIARRLAVPENTVRTRLQRAHASLRARLDAVHGDRGWAAFAAPIAALPVSIPAGLALAPLGGMVMNKVLAAAGLALLLGAALWWPWPATAPVAPPLAGANADTSAPTVEPHDDLLARQALAAAPTSAPPAAEPPPPPPPRDPTEAELLAFAATVDAGRIEGIVLRGLEPIRGGRAWLRAAEAGGLPWGGASAWDAASGVQRAPIGGDGMFRFADVAPANYAVGIETDDGVSRHIWFDTSGGGTTQRIRIVLGTSTIRGRAHTEDGLPASGWQAAVFVSGGMLARAQLIVATVADARGEFAVAGLYGGRYQVQASPTENFADPRMLSNSVELATGETQTVWLGQPIDACSWSGRVLLPHGGPLQATTPVTLEVERAPDEGGTTSFHPLSADGEFAFRVAAGQVRVQLKQVCGARVDLGTVTIAGAVLQRDLVIPAAVLRVQPRAADTNLPTFALGRLRRGNGMAIDSLRCRDGKEHWLGLAPGDYLMQFWPTPIAGAPREGMRVTIGPADVEIDLDAPVAVAGTQRR